MTRAEVIKTLYRDFNYEQISNFITDLFKDNREITIQQLTNYACRRFTDGPTQKGTVKGRDVEEEIL